MEHLKIVFKVLKDNQLYVKKEKCAFAQEEVMFLGHKVGGGTLAMDDSKVQTIKEWGVPTKVTELRSFLGLLLHLRISDHRPHRSGSTSSEIFICFTSRTSSSSASSMKISSKSILSPARTDKLREPALSLSSSLSRRLRSNGSMKGGQASPMFPTGNKKRGSAFENPEPSSPKVTCIGQVRVKSKNQGKKMRTRSKRRGEASFRKTEQTQEGIQQHHHECLPHRNQRWVHIPLTICEALRTFGAEFNCFLPCRSSCSSAHERQKEEKTRTDTTSSSSCGAVFARWLMAIQEGEEEKRTEIRLMVGEENSWGKTDAVNVDVMEIGEKGEVEEIDEEEESICIPPRNALLLMRCRSESFRMSSLANRFWDSPTTKDDDHADADEDDEEDSEEEDDDDGEGLTGDAEAGDDEEHKEKENVEEVKVELDEKQGEEEMDTIALGEPSNPEENEDSEMQGNAPVATAEVQEGEENPESGVEGDSVKEEHHDAPVMEHTEGQIMENGYSAEALEETENQENEATAAEQETSSPDRIIEEETEAEAEGEEGRRASSSSSSSSAVSVDPTEVETEEGESDQEAAELAEVAQMALEERVEDLREEKESEDRAQKTETEKTQEAEICETEPPQNQQRQQQNEPHEDQNKDGQVQGPKKKSEERQERSKLPDCLLLMLCEPKLSMEVSKETWVRSTDFIRCRTEKPVVIPKDDRDESSKRVSTDSNPPQQQQHQSLQQQQAAQKSCSNPAPPSAVATPAPSMAAMIEQKLVNAKAYEPFVLTRCKSEPVWNSTKLAPEACFWKNRRLEPHRPTTLGVAGVGLGC
ncbi:hypothetical protein NE237_002281 [Protea cynaroides]|uniref:Uncharacterized protein n=1 Tax=Protea cynaroides TaxID=273540 RepID=A0A9Q0QZB3_9MAGN|nr:hypothetical protein NE237_002281 [Protea cynaroides]